MKHTTKLFILFSATVFTAYAPDILIGDAQLTTQTFTFPVKTYAFSVPHSFFFTGAHQAIANNTYAVALATLASNNTFVPLTPAQVTLDNKKEQTNPLFGAKINLMALFGDSPVVVKAGDESSFYMIHNFDNLNDITMLSAHDVHDATGASGAKIIGITTDGSGSLGIDKALAVIAAVTNAAGVFGQPGSGIAIAPLLNESGTASFKFSDNQAGKLGENRAAALDISSSAIKINSNAQNITNTVVDMHWDKDFARLYIALQAQAGTNPTDGVRSVVVGKLTDKILTFEPIAPDAAISTDSIIGAVGANTQVSIHKVRTMHTTTWLHYLIVNGGVGASAVTKNQVFALPLVYTEQMNEYWGKLAKKSATPQNLFAPFGSNAFKNRFLNEPATSAGDLFTSTDAAALVGSGDTPGDVTDLFVRGDAVFVMTGSAGDFIQPGLFYSQAIFDSHGRIARWTPWQRVAGFAKPTFGAALDIQTGNFWYMTGPHENAIQTVARTSWQSPSTRADIITNFFPQEIGGVRGILDIPVSSLGLTAVTGFRSSLLVTTGFDRVLIAQTGEDDASGNFGSQVDLSRGFTSKDGSLTGFSPGVSYIAITGGALSAIGPIITAAMITDSVYGWLVVGGTKGVAILANDDGTGWASGLQKGFVGLSSTMKFKVLGNYQQVRRVVADAGYLYILTLNSLDRIAIAPASFATTNTLPAVNIARLDTFKGQPGAGIFHEFIASGQLGLLGTAHGLFRTGNGRDISTAQKPDDVQWTAVDMPESAGGAHRFKVINPVATYPPALHNSNIWILNASVSQVRSRLYRYVIDLSNGVTNSSVMLFPDFFIAGRPTFFLNVGDYRNGFMVDGATMYLTRSAYNGMSPFVELVQANLRSGNPYPLVSSMYALIAQNFHSLERMIRVSGDGSLLVSGEFGIKLNQ